MSCAETENISSRVNVTIMLNTTFNTLPVSYRKSSYSLRSAQASAFGARSRGIGFIDFSVDNTGLLALVVEHCLEAGPACVKRRLGHRGFCQLRATDISHVDLAASIDQIAAVLPLGTRAINRDTDAKIPSTASILSETTCPEPVLARPKLSHTLK
ncbi:hypothetical protein IMCC3135_05915 [Granulosicoccus antarcticus IMCC3135]|uniref:Uncharacterized protein n=1 Tax=Granulosicoccus antarcticus IMCC3135 TaxID=1192854 RepID=A0A2Z2NL86_9GAMM|nr:hypothetical protein IMCC3135_05915 [Granulosicoccus antarcticus IMCC3135]